MEIAAIVLAALALLIALSGRAKLNSLRSALDDVRSDSRRLAGNVADEAQLRLDTVRQQLADLADGKRPSRSMILEGRTWGEVMPNEGMTWMADELELRWLDVRTPQETAGGIIAGALIIPVDELEARLREVPQDGCRTIVYCAGGGRSAAACEFLADNGLANLHNLEGGLSSWSGPLEKPA
jgi:rhodanese-related sulfurtransferase